MKQLPSCENNTDKFYAKKKINQKYALKKCNNFFIVKTYNIQSKIVSALLWQLFHFVN